MIPAHGNHMHTTATHQISLAEELGVNQFLEVGERET